MNKDTAIHTSCTGKKELPLPYDAYIKTNKKQAYIDWDDVENCTDMEVFRAKATMWHKKYTPFFEESLVKIIVNNYIKLVQDDIEAKVKHVIGKDISNEEMDKIEQKKEDAKTVIIDRSNYDPKSAAALLKLLDDKEKTQQLQHLTKSCTLPEEVKMKDN